MFITSIKFVQTIRKLLICTEPMKNTSTKLYSWMHTKKKKTERKLDKQERNYDVQILKLYQIRPIFNNFEFEYNAK